MSKQALLPPHQVGPNLFTTEALSKSSLIFPLTGATTTTPTVVAPPASTQTGLPTGWKYAGCYAEGTTGRSLTQQQPDSNTNSSKHVLQHVVSSAAPSLEWNTCVIVCLMTCYTRHSASSPKHVLIYYIGCSMLL